MKLYDLPSDILDSQLSILKLVSSMFSLPGELDIPTETAEFLQRISTWDRSSEVPPFTIPENLSFSVNLTLSIENSERSVQLMISAPLKSTEPNASEPDPLHYSIRQPAWMSKAEVGWLSSSMPEDDIFAAFEYIREEAPKCVKPAQDKAFPSNSSVKNDPIIRVWFYFPSLSTREKRDDLVNHAPGYELTGFVLAGKPGVLCLEGTSAHVDAYMKFIKTHSWGDIPSYQKKVSEKYREEDEGLQRVFSNMQEITDSLGERRGERANRGDMKALEAWLMEKGLQGAFEKVIM
ncbi:hypothetical protein BP5796_04011 [Coleophoma crateriformis]|uniref:Small nuclear ribonucleoprotein Prp3 C-terminal domain-containing protein n=1 Tax=Coleophoma crateriformis TaxID=565419 RepID=A0A3D8SH99_9HELO|nr:hypothetical protein BP5796_04011 [Coleophoma crateriformis]